MYTSTLLLPMQTIHLSSQLHHNCKICSIVGGMFLLAVFMLCCCIVQFLHNRYSDVYTRTCMHCIAGQNPSYNSSLISQHV